MVRFDIKLLTWLALDKTIEHLEQDIKAVESYDNGRITEIYFLYFDDKLAADKNIRDKARHAKQKVSEFCTQQDIEIHEIPVDIEKSSFKKLEISIPSIKKGLLPKLNDMGEVYINCSEESELSTFWDCCKEEDFFGGQAIFVGKNEQGNDALGQINLSEMIAKVEAYIVQQKDTIELIKETIKEKKDCLCFVCEDKQKYLDIQGKIPSLKDYYVNGVYSLKDYEYLPKLQCSYNLSLYILTKTKPEFVDFLYVAKENFALLQYLYTSLQNWLNIKGDYPDILKKHINRVPYLKIDMDHVDAHYNSKDAFGFRLSIGKKKSKKLSDFARCITWNVDSQDFILCSEGNKIIGKQEIRNRLHLDKIPKSKEEQAACRVQLNDIIADISLGKECKFYLIQECSEDLFISKDMVCIRPLSGEILPEFLCLYLNAQTQSKSLVSKYLSYMEGPLLLKDFECMPVVISDQECKAEDSKKRAYYQAEYLKYLENNSKHDIDELSAMQSYELSKTVFDDCILGDNIFSKKELTNFANSQKELKEKIRNYVLQGDFAQGVVQIAKLIEDESILWCSRVAGKDYIQGFYRKNKKMSAEDAADFLQRKKLISSALFLDMKKLRETRNGVMHTRLQKQKVSEDDFYNAENILNEFVSANDDWTEVITQKSAKKTLDAIENEK